MRSPRRHTLDCCIDTAGSLRFVPSHPHIIPPASFSSPSSRVPVPFFFASYPLGSNRNVLTRSCSVWCSGSVPLSANRCGCGACCGSVWRDGSGIECGQSQRSGSVAACTTHLVGRRVLVDCAARVRVCGCGATWPGFSVRGKVKTKVLTCFRVRATASCTRCWMPAPSHSACAAQVVCRRLDEIDDSRNTANTRSDVEPCSPGQDTNLVGETIHCSFGPFPRLSALHATAKLISLLLL